MTTQHKLQPFWGKGYLTEVLLVQSNTVTSQQIASSKSNKKHWLKLNSRHGCIILLVCKEGAIVAVAPLQSLWTELSSTGPKGTDPSGVVRRPRKHCPEGGICTRAGPEGHGDVVRQPPGLQQQLSCPGTESRHVERPHGLPRRSVLRRLPFHWILTAICC